MEFILKNKILLVEDDRRLSKLISAFLTQNEFDVKCLFDSYNVEQAMASYAPDVVVLDIMLPGEDGLSLCRKIRHKFGGPLLFLTAKSSDFDQVVGLELGADDYIIKPVEPRVLLARIHALMRRSTPLQKEPRYTSRKLAFGSLQINKDSRQVLLEGESVSLTSHEFDMLWKLASNASILVERSTLYTELIGREYDGMDRSADVRISRIRKKLKDDPQNPFRIKTIWGKGFFFVPDAWD